MRKTFYYLFVCLMCLFISVCSSCNKKSQSNDVVKAELNVENAISLDKEYMFTNYRDYSWFETCVLLKDFLDAECDGTVKGISNVFQVIENKETGYDTQVILASHVADTTAYEIKHGFWVEDFPLNNELIQVTFAEAFEKINEVNLPKPHSQQVVLRKQIGPKSCNTQWIFGNQKAQLYVDAITGEVTDKSPAFPEE